MSYITPSSFKRHHRKGFTDHVVNKPGEGKKPVPKPFFPAEMTNRERNEWRRDRRKALKEQEQAK